FKDADGVGPAGASIDRRLFHGPDVDQVFADENALGEVLWNLTDHQGTVRDIVEYDDSTSTTEVAKHIRYGAFGNIDSVEDGSGTVLPNGADDLHYAYTGREWDQDAELYFYRARWYDGVTGRFVSEDPMGFEAGDANLNRYVGNGVWNATDPSGLEKDGHHWLVQSVIKALEGNVTKEAGDMMQRYTTLTGNYSHGYDTFYTNGRRVTHDAYNKAIKDLVNSARKAGGGRVLQADAVEGIIDGIHKGGKSLTNLLKQHGLAKTAIDTIVDWRGGFLDSIDLAESLARAKDLAGTGKLAGDLDGLRTMSRYFAAINSKDQKRVSRMLTASDDLLKLAAATGGNSKSARSALERLTGDKKELIKKLHDEYRKLGRNGKEVFNGLHQVRMAKNTAWTAFATLGSGTAALRMNESIARLGGRFTRYGKIAAKARGLIDGTIRVAGGFIRVAGPIAAIGFAFSDVADGADGSEEYPELTGPIGSAVTATDRFFFGAYVRNGLQIAASPISDNIKATTESAALNREFDIGFFNRLARDSDTDFGTLRVGGKRGGNLGEHRTDFSDPANSWLYRTGWSLMGYGSSFHKNADGSWSTK
ncbi:MAG: RHS repeat-associated core domain-containing protein, partial [Fuerstiella sp.]